MFKLGKQHWEAIKWIFIYLESTMSYGIMFSSEHGKYLVVGYVDSDYVSDVNDRRPTIGHVFTIAGRSICWKLLVQSIVGSCRQLNQST